MGTGLEILVAEALVAAGTTAETAAVAAPILSTAITAVGAAGLSYGISALINNGDKANTAPPQQTIRQALPFRNVVLGRCRVAGTLYFYDAITIAPGTDAGFLLLCIGKVMACHPINAFESHFLFDYDVGPLSMTNEITNPPPGRFAWSQLIQIFPQNGTVDQASNPFLLANWSSDGIWTDQHRLRGLANVAIGYADANVTDGTFYSDYPNGPPDYRAVIQGRLVFDPRDPTQNIDDESTWKYSDNAALIIAWYLMHPDGWGLGSGVIDQSNLAGEAAYCDQLTPTPDGGNEPTWRIWGEYRQDEARKDILNDLLMACLGHIQPQQDGTIKITAGRFFAPAVTLTDDDILALESFTDGPEAVERVDVVNPSITYEPFNWETYDVPEWDAALSNLDLGVDGQTSAGTTLSLPLRFCPSPYQAQRIAKKVADEKNSGWRGKIRTRLTGLAAYGEWTIAVRSTELTFLDGLIFEVLGISLDSATMTLSISVREMSPDVWDWPAGSGTLIGQVPAIPDSTFPTTSPSAVTATYAVVGGGYGITISWTNSDTSIYSNQVQYRPAAPPGPAGWIEDDPPVGATSQTTPELTTGSFYDIQVRSVGFGFSVSNWVTVYNVKCGP